jgi:hypothetical protein
MKTTRPRPASVIFLDTRTGGTHLRYGMVVATKGTAPRRMYLLRWPEGGESWQHEMHVDLAPLFPERARAGAAATLGRARSWGRWALLAEGIRRRRRAPLHHHGHVGR